MNKIQDQLSLKLNGMYHTLKQQKVELQRAFLEQQTELKNPKNLKQLQKRFRAVEKQMHSVRSKCRVNLKRNIRNGVNIVGALERDLLNTEEALKKSLAVWARKRGYSFEKLFVENVNNYAKQHDYSLLAYRNYATKFGFQPYDVAVYIKNESPVFFECKASGIVENSKGLRLQACKRRYVNYTLKSVDKLKQFLARTGSLTCFVFREEASKSLYFVNADLILEHADYLCRQQLELRPEDYYVIPFSALLWQDQLFQKIKNHFHYR